MASGRRLILLTIFFKTRQRERHEIDRAAYDGEARISEFREFVFRLRTEAGLTQGELASRMGTTQSAIARMEGGRKRPTLDTLEKLATAVGSELVGVCFRSDSGDGAVR